MARLRDIILAVIGLSVLMVPMVIIAVVLAVTQERVLFWQERTGYRGRTFRMVKFSTLRDIRSGEREEDDQRERLTWAGKWLRRFSVDEWPQLWHVLIGDMRLVGPRPVLHEYWSLYSEHQKKRFEVRPGITGWAQVNGRNALSFTERFELDVWYVEHRSFGLDGRILIRSLRGMGPGDGVYADARTTMEKFNGHK